MHIQEITAPKCGDKFYIPSALVSEHVHKIDETGGLKMVRKVESIEENSRIVDYIIWFFDCDAMFCLSMIVHRQDELEKEFGGRVVQTTQILQVGVS